MRTSWGRHEAPNSEMLLSSRADELGALRRCLATPGTGPASAFAALGSKAEGQNR